MLTLHTLILNRNVVFDVLKKHFQIVLPLSHLGTSGSAGTYSGHESPIHHILDLILAEPIIYSRRDIIDILILRLII